MAITMKLIGDDKLVAEFRKAESEVVKDTKALIRKTVDDMTDTAKEKAPTTGTGALGLSVEPKITGSGLGGSVSAFGGDKFYAAFVEYGTFKDRAQPFMRPAFDKHEPRYLNEMVRIINRRF